MPAQPNTQPKTAQNLASFNVNVPSIISVGFDLNKTNVGVKGQWGTYKERSLVVPVPEFVQGTVGYGYSFVQPYAQWAYKKVFEYKQE